MSILETERLVLRKLTPDDAKFIRELLNDPSFLRNIGDKQVRTNEDAVVYIQNGPMLSYQHFGFGLYQVRLRETAEPIGMCGLLKRDALPDPDIGFAFLPRFHSKGYATEAASAVLAFARESLELKRVLAITLPENNGSIRVLEKIGLGFEGMIKLNDDEPELKLFAVNLDK